jgi:hypothetical protein
MELINSQFVLFVEGKDELNVFSKMTSEMDFASLQIIDVGGQDNFRIRVEALASQRAFRDIRLLGIVRDKEEDGAAAFESIRETLTRVGLPCPASPGEVAGVEKRVLVALLPPNQNDGCVETMFVQAVEVVEAGRCHDTLRECIRKMPGAAEFTQARFNKIAALSILSSLRPKYYTSVGLALKSGDFGAVLHALPLHPLWEIVETLQRLSREVG